ncbi:MAG TPA: hypothetical protein VIQ60_14440 [Gemmatimonadaceae bacterium]
MTIRWLLLLTFLVLTPVACAPKAPPLRGAIVPVRLPGATLPPLHRKLVFLWEYTDESVRAQGDGAARVAPPDSMRLDLFIGGGYGGGSAVLIDDELTTSGSGQISGYLPPVPLLWASLGRLAVPTGPDTTVRVDGDTLRVEIGHSPTWRATFAASRLCRLELIEGGRIRQWVTRDSAGHVHYEHEGARRTLNLTVTRVDTVSAFDATIWR